MKFVENKISSLIETQFPAFYKEEGQNFIAFVKAYYEWLETLYVIADLRDPTGFDVGDTITQNNKEGLATGTIIGKNGSIVYVKNDTENIFRCVLFCQEITPVYSSSGASTFIETTDSTSANYHSRKLFDYRDVDTTLDKFIIFFKEKYLNNVQFTTISNKKLLVKKAQDLYRTKGTERAVDLFFKLVYGINSKVYVPGTDVLKASDGKWVKPIYLEVTRETRNIDYVGKQVTGSNSGATAFVEKLVRKRIKGQYIDIFYISAVNGDFQSNEIILVDEVYDGAPTCIGSFTTIDVLGQTSGYVVGDIVDIITSEQGAYGKARVTRVSDTTGVVDFEFIDGGFGYTTTSEVLVSEKVLSLSNVIVSDSSLVTPFTQFETITQNIANVTYQPVISLSLASNTDAFTDGEVIYQSLDGANTVLATVINSNSSIVKVKYANTGEFTTALQISGETSGSNGLISDVSYDTNQINPGDAFISFYSNSVISGEGIVVQRFTNSTPYIGVLKVAVSNGNIYDVSNANYSEFISVGNFSGTATVNAYANVSATANVIGISDSLTLYLSEYVPTFQVGEVVSQSGSANAVVSIVQLDGSNVYLGVTSSRGVFDLGTRLVGASSNASANVRNYSLRIGLYDINNTFTNTGSHFVTGNLSNTVAGVESISAGVGADFDIISLDNEEQVVYGTDLISGLNSDDVQYRTLNIDSTYYGFPKLPSGNSTNATILQQLDYFTGNIGSVSVIGNINPGSNYNVDPFVVIHNKFISAFDRKDLIIEYSKTSPAGFILDEIVTQAVAIPNAVILNVSDVSNTFVVGELINQSNGTSNTANGYISSISITANSGSITLRNTQGTFVNTGFNSALGVTGFTSLTTATVTNADDVEVTAFAKGVVKNIVNATAVLVKPITFNTEFVEAGFIVGSGSGANGVILNISRDETSLPSGINAQITADVITANGTVAGLSRLDSGYGYVEGQIVEFATEGKTQGTARIHVGRQGQGEGYYSATDGFLSADKKIFDGDYYQEYSYEIISKLPFDKYASIFKDVMHIAGTRVFGAIEIDNLLMAPLQSQSSYTTKKYDLYLQNFVGEVLDGEQAYQTNVASGITEGSLRSIIEVSGANNSFQIGTTITDGGNRSGTLVQKDSDYGSNTTTLYLIDVVDGFSNTDYIEGQSNTILDVSYKTNAQLSSIITPTLETGSFKVGEYVRNTSNTVIAIVEAASDYEVILETLSGTITSNITLIGDESKCSAKLQNINALSPIIGESIYQRETILFIGNATGQFELQEEVYSAVLNPSSNNQLFQNTAVGVIDFANSTVLKVRNVFGDFIKNTDINGKTSGKTSTVLDLRENIHFQGTVAGANSSTITVVDVIGEFAAGNYVDGANTFAIATGVSTDVLYIDSSDVQSAINILTVSNTVGQFSTDYQLTVQPYVGEGTVEATIVNIEIYND
jgi:hypothetical protein